MTGTGGLPAVVGWDLHGHAVQLTADQQAAVHAILDWHAGRELSLPPQDGSLTILVTAARYARARAAHRDPR